MASCRFDLLLNGSFLCLFKIEDTQTVHINKLHALYLKPPVETVMRDTEAIQQANRNASNLSTLALAGGHSFLSLVFCHFLYIHSLGLAVNGDFF